MNELDGVDKKTISIKDINDLQEAVLKKRPILREIIEKRGKKNLIEYAEDYREVNLNKIVIKRQEELLDVFYLETKEKLGEEVAKQATDQLRKYYFVSTADHHGPICHPFFLNSNLVTSINSLVSNLTDLKYIIVFSCANVSFSNSSFPRGLLFHGSDKNDLKMQSLGFFPASSSVRQSRVFRFPAYRAEDVEKMKIKVQELLRNGELKMETANDIKNILNEVYLSPEVLSCNYYSDQITKTNYSFWSIIFKKIGVEGTKLLYIELESIVSRLLVNYHLFRKTTISSILFDDRYSNLFIKFFDGIEGGFSLKDNWGTYLFWALPKGERYCKQLRKEGNHLVSIDGKYRVELTPEAIKQAILDKELLPGTQLSLLVLSLYYGLKCLGGFCQVNYLTQMLDVYRSFLEEAGEEESLLACERTQTKELGEDLAISFLAGPNGKRDLATGLDLILYGNGDTWENLLSESKNMSFATALLSMMPEFYKIMYSEIDRDPKLAAITAEDIMRVNGLDEKIKPCIAI